MKAIRTYLTLFIVLPVWFSCTTTTSNPDLIGLNTILLEDYVLESETNISPLTATISLETESPVIVTLRIKGKPGQNDFIQVFSEPMLSPDIPVLGLYPDHENQVTLNLYTEDGQGIGSRQYTFKTDPLDVPLPDFETNILYPRRMTPGWTLANLNINNKVVPVFFDLYGEPRWILDLDAHPFYGEAELSNGIHFTRNGTFIMGDSNSGSVYEFSMTGNLIRSWDLPGYHFYNSIFEKSSGDLLIGASISGASTVGDQILEISRSENEILNSWDLTQILMPDRLVSAESDRDWFGLNGIILKNSEKQLVVTGRNQGVINLNYDKEILWIMAPHLGWGMNARGEDLNDYLLQPMDPYDSPLTDEKTLQGIINSPFFEWVWNPQRTVSTSTGSIAVYDAGYMRNYEDQLTYSQVVEYLINDADKTIQRIWRYGKTAHIELFSPQSGDLIYVSNRDHMIMTFGAIEGEALTARIIELNKSSQNVIFEGTFTFPEGSSLAGVLSTTRAEIYR